MIILITVNIKGNKLNRIIFYIFRSMSSKRKNTPTKLPRDDVVNERPIYNQLPQDRHNFDFERDISYQPALHIVDSNLTTNGFENHDSNDSNSYDQPQNKKQRILQSVRNSSDSESDSESNFNSNNNLTKPGLGLHKKSMESVLRRLNTHRPPDGLTEQEYLDKYLKMSQRGGAGEVQMFCNIQKMLTDNTVEDKEEKIGQMIAQLQNLKDSIRKDKQVWDISCIHRIFKIMGKDGMTYFFIEFFVYSKSVTNLERCFYSLKEIYVFLRLT